MYSFENRLILITGASSGLGKAIALEFAKENVKIALVARKDKLLNAISKKINVRGDSLSKVFPFDLRDNPKIPALIKQIESAFGKKVDILVNAAGIATLGYVENIPIGEYYENFEVNFFSGLALIQAVIPGMKEKKRGKIINITSGFGIRGIPGCSSYCATKFALNGLTESLRVELKPFGVDVISISPGHVNTPFVKNQKVFGVLSQRFTNNNMKEPNEVARKVLRASKNGIQRVELTIRAKIVRHLNNIFPSLLDYILEKKMIRKMPK